MNTPLAIGLSVEAAGALLSYVWPAWIYKIRWALGGANSDVTWEDMLNKSRDEQPEIPEWFMRTMVFVVCFGWPLVLAEAIRAGVRSWFK